MAVMTCIVYHLAALLLCSWRMVSGEDGIEVAGIHSLDHNGSLPTTGYQQPVKPVQNSMGIPDFSVVENNRVCVRASFESKIVIKYRTAGTSQLPTRVLETETSVPRDALVSGQCGGEHSDSEIRLVWDVYSLTFTFTMQRVEDTSLSAPVMTWSARNITITINTTSPHFHTPRTGGIHEVINTDSSHFNTPANFSFSCSSEQSLELQENNEAEQTISEVILSMWSTQIQAYELPADGEFKQSAKCMMDISIPTQNTVPIAVAVCLAILIFIVITVYFVMRRQSKLHYRGLE